MAALIVAALFLAVFAALVWAEWRDQSDEDPTDPARGVVAPSPPGNDAPGGPTCRKCGDPVFDAEAHTMYCRHPSGGTAHA